MGKLADSNEFTTGLLVLREETEALAAALASMEEEHAALISGNPTRIQSAMATKTAALERYMRAKAARETHGLPESFDGTLADFKPTQKVPVSTDQHIGMHTTRLRAHTQTVLASVSNRDGLSEYSDAVSERRGRVLGTA